MLLFLACLRACVAAAQCHDAEPHLQKREWVDGDRHCSYREKAERSCFDGEWTEKSRVFDNSYFTDLLTKTYAPETVAATGCPQHRSRAGTIMLVSDLALLEDPAFRAVVEEYAADQSLFFEEYASAWIKLQENGVAEQLRDAL